MFRFTIRDVLWLTVVAALSLGLGLGWWRDHGRLSSELAGLEAERQESAREAEWATLRARLAEYKLNRETGQLKTPPSKSELLQDLEYYGLEYLAPSD
jgi:hypothetical protein